jgi:hypothetical protein
MKTTEKNKMTTTLGLRKKVFAWLLILGTVSLSGCNDKAVEDAGGTPAAEIQDIPGSVLKRVTLTKEAARRIDLKTETAKAGAAGIEIPYGALLYDPDGKTWAFVNVTGLSFERQAITVTKIVGDVVSLSKGPVEGTKVVTLGATQLYGAEIGVGDE